jgi:hypothetical protein
MKGDTYVFRIDRFTPETMPMARLAEYITELAALLGSDERVHLKALRKGSVQLISTVETEAVPKVRIRLQQVMAPSPTDEVSAHYKKIDDLLAADNAVGTIKRQNAVVLRFPGRTNPRPPRIGPFTQSTELRGQLVRVGGRDESAHALVQDVEGAIWKVTLTRIQARELAGMLYGPPLRISGNGRWERNEQGKWVMLEMRLQSWEQLSEESLRAGITTLRAIEGSEWPTESDPGELLRRIRNGDDEVH